MEQVHTLSSAHLSRQCAIWIRRPHQTATQPCLTIFLDAELYRNRVGASEVIDQLEANLAIHPSYFVFVSSGSEADRWKECPCYSPFADFVVLELIPWLTQAFPELRSPTRRILVGLSYTGLAASYVAYREPELFDCVIAQSGSFWSNDCELTKRYADSQTPLKTAFYLDVGSKETPSYVRHKEDVVQTVDQITAVEHFRDTLLRTGHRVEYQQFEGGHSSDCWRRTLPNALRWAIPARPSEPQLQQS